MRLGNTRVGPARFGCLRVEPGPHGFRQFAGRLGTAENAIDGVPWLNPAQPLIAAIGV